MRIWYQSAVEMGRAGAYSDALQAHFERIADPGVEVSLFGAEPGTWGDLQPAQVSGYPYVFHAVVKNIFIDAALRAEAEGYDAFVIGSSTDPGLREARSLVDIPVVSALESSVLVSSTVARKVGLVVPTDEVGHILRTNLEDYLLSGKVASFEVLDAKLTDDQLNALFADPDAFLSDFADTARRSIEKGADAIIPAEGILAEVIASSGMTEIDGARVIDPVGTAIAFVEMQVKLAAHTGLHPGRRWHYAKPPVEVVRVIRDRS